MAKSLVTLAHKYVPSKHNVVGWYMSEKLDGVRAIWDGKNFITRNGKILHAPYRITGHLEKRNLPKLDGELYLGRGRFSECCGIVRRHDDAWIGIEYHIFDIQMEGLFEYRYEMLKKIAAPLPPFIKVVDQMIVESTDQIAAEHSRIMELGGEGLMFKYPYSSYEYKRTTNLLKLKAWQECEAVVKGFVGGEGKYEGMIGALVCQLDNGTIFQCGSGLTDQERVLPNKLQGKTITVKYFELSADGVPRFPIFKGERIDA